MATTSTGCALNLTNLARLKTVHSNYTSTSVTKSVQEYKPNICHGKQNRRNLAGMLSAKGLIVNRAFRLDSSSFFTTTLKSTGAKQCSRKHATGVTCLLTDGGLLESLPLVLGVGVGLPCTVMECGDVIYRSTLPPGDPFKLTVAGVSLALLVAAYLWSTPGVAPGFWDMFVLAPLERLYRRKLTKDDLVIGKKLGEGAFGTVYRAKFANPEAGKDVDLVVKKATEFGAAEIWMNERVRRACPSNFAEFTTGFVEWNKKTKAEQFWLVWKFEGDLSLADVMANKDFPYNVEYAVLGPKADYSLPLGAEREARVIRALMTQLLVALNRLHSVGIVHRDIKPQNVIFCKDSGQLKIIDLGAAADLRVGINYAPKEFLLDPRYAAPEQYIMSTQTPTAPPPPVAAALSPVLWQMNLPDRFDIYSTGLIFLQMVFPGLRTDSALISFNRQLKRYDYDLTVWRESVSKRASPEMLRGFQMLDMDAGHGWALAQSMIRFKGRQRISAGGALAHPFFFPGDLPLLQRIRLTFLRAAYADNSEVTEAFLTFMARSGTSGVGGFTEASLQDMKAKERKRLKATLQRNALASALRLQRKVVRTLGSTAAELQNDSKKKWWNRWET